VPAVLLPAFAVCLFPLRSPQNLSSLFPKGKAHQLLQDIFLFNVLA
jgi:hypothetical protein